MSKSIIKYVCAALSVILLLSLIACQNEKKEEVEKTNIGTTDVEMPTSDSGEADSDVEVTPEPTKEPVVEFSDEWSEKIF